MSYHKTEYIEDIQKPLLDWLTNSGSGKNVTNLSLSLANRAQRNIWEEKPWSNLAVKQLITLTDGSYTFPENFGRIIEMFADLTGDGTPDYWYYEGYDQEGGYELTDSFDKSTGHSWAITFHYAQQSGVYLRYQNVLEDFTGEGTEYSYFPANLVLLECQKINTLEKGNTKEYSYVENAYDKALKKYSNANQWVNADPSPRMNDRLGYEIYTNSYSLSGESVGPYSSLPNSYLP